jgi:hypothetical protein
MTMRYRLDSSSDELRVRAYYRHKREAAGRELSVNR